MPKKKESSERPTSARLLKNRPLDPDADFETPVRKPSSELPGAKENPIAAAAKELGPDHTVGPAQRPLLAPVEQAQKPKPVQNGRLLATYVGLGLERDKDNEKLVHLDFSFPLEKEHDSFIPKRVKDAWEWLKKSDNPLVQVGSIPPVMLEIFLDPKEKKPLLKVEAAEFSKAVIAVIEETGKRKSKLVTRFKFRLRTDRSDEVIEWAAWHDGEEFWVTLEPSQRELDL